MHEHEVKESVLIWLWPKQGPSIAFSLPWARLSSCVGEQKSSSLQTAEEEEEEEEEEETTRRDDGVDRGPREAVNVRPPSVLHPERPPNDKERKRC